MARPELSIPQNRDVWRIAAPLILSNISVPLLGMVDTAVTGHLDSAVHLGAVAIGSTIFSFLYSGVNFLRMGTTGITARIRSFASIAVIIERCSCVTMPLDNWRTLDFADILVRLSKSSALFLEKRLWTDSTKLRSWYTRIHLDNTATFDFEVNIVNNAHRAITL